MVELYRNGKEFATCAISVLFNLILYKLGDEDRKIRRSSIQLLQIITSRREIDGEESDFWGNNYYNNAVDASLSAVYLQAQVWLLKLQQVNILY